MPRDDAKFKEVEIPTRVDVASVRDRELEPEFDADSSLADTTPESQFRRAERRISVRKSTLPKKTASRIRIAMVVVAAITLAAVAYGSVYRYGTRSWRFRLDSSDDITISGLNRVTRSQVMEVLGADIGRNVFYVPLEQRRAQLEAIPWIESASVMRLLPNRIAVQVQERTPIAFVQIGSRIQLVDAHGVIMELPRRTHYSFPVVLGLSESDPLSTRAAQMKLYSQLVNDLDTGDAHYSKDLSDVDLRDPENLKVTVGDPAGAVLVSLGNAQFLERFKIYLAHIGDWRQQFQKVESVDLRYEGQIIVNPETAVAERRPAATPKSYAKAISPRRHRGH
ncbi:MAG TPA: FtsQ-type POTRA domain-containing protein [Terriglobales bacterium]|nr:FtsQ-type POTRA domain-containing protein [Terriglobales bacterium]